MIDSAGELFPKKVSRKHLRLAINASFEHQVELNEIENHRGEGKSREYLVSYKGFSKSHNKWLKPEDFGDHEIIRQYLLKLKGKKPLRRGGRKKKPIVKLDL